MKKHLFFLLFACFALSFGSFAQDAVFKTLRAELDRNFSVLKTQPTPAYYILLRTEERTALECRGRMGRLQSPAILNQPVHELYACLRVGSPALDNSHEIRDANGAHNNFRSSRTSIPNDNNPMVLKSIIRQQIDDLYKAALPAYEQVKANLAVKVEQDDKSPDFSDEPVEKYYEKPITWASLKINPKDWEEKARKYSAVFDENPDIYMGEVKINFSLKRKIFIDTEGRENTQNVVALNILLTAETLADDGMILPMFKSWDASSTADLPSDEEVLAAAREISRTLSALKNAPTVDSYTGPAILSPEASAVFFNQLFGKRVEGARLKRTSDSQTFKNKVNEPILPEHLSISFDPTQKKLGKTALNGYYVFDDEGIRGKKVEIVKNGVLKDFLMCRTPIDGFPHSNGHGRGNFSTFATTRQSNMFVESAVQLSDNELIERLRKELKEQGKEAGYYFDKVEAGGASTGRSSINAFNITPLTIYKIYADGRPNELVRGLDIIGTPLAIFSSIEACGQTKAVFNSEESKVAPVSAIAPALLIKHLETQKRASGQIAKPILSEPQATATAEKDPDKIILGAIQKEIQRGLDSLSLPNMQKPFYISYRYSPVNSLIVTAVNGSIKESSYISHRTPNSYLYVGSYQNAENNYYGESSVISTFDTYPCFDTDEKGIRYAVWLDLDPMYKMAAEAYEQKQSALKNLNLPQWELDLPDFDKAPTVNINTVDNNVKNKNDRKFYENYVKAVSSVFNEYKDLTDNNFRLHLNDGKNYFCNTEKTTAVVPDYYINMTIDVKALTSENEDVTENIVYTVRSEKELPSVAEMKNRCRALAEKVLAAAKAPKIEEAYIGPVLFEDAGVWQIVSEEFTYGLTSNRGMIYNMRGWRDYVAGSEIDDLLGKRVAAKGVKIEDLSGSKEYKGVKLYGYRPIDNQGVVPAEKLTLVENGLLKKLLNDRVPTRAAPHSTGHYGGSRVIRLSDTVQMSRQELKNELLRLARDEGNDYAYIIRKYKREDNYEGNRYVVLWDIEIYRIDLDGNETRVRSAAMPDFRMKDFKKIVAVSDKEQIYNGRDYKSVISPDAILFKDLQIEVNKKEDAKLPIIVPKN